MEKKVKKMGRPKLSPDERKQNVNTAFSVMLDKDVATQFRDKCKENRTNMSWLIETFVRAYINGEVEAKLIAPRHGNDSYLIFKKTKEA